jgi:hypothetical protein
MNVLHKALDKTLAGTIQCLPAAASHAFAQLCTIKFSLIEYVHLLGIRLSAREYAPRIFFPLFLTLQRGLFPPRLTT